LKEFLNSVNVTLRESGKAAEKLMGTITKSLNLLNYFSESVPEIGLMGFKNLTGQDKATIHRHLTELQKNGFLEQNDITKKYRLGAAILRLAAVRETTFPARRIVSQWVTTLSEKLEELVHASLISGNNLSPLCFNDGGVGGTRVYFSEAEILPLHATASGLAGLAYGPTNLLGSIRQADLRRYTETTITDFQSLMSLVNEVRVKGFTMTDQSFEPEVSSIAVPFFEGSTFAYGTIAVAVPSSRMENLDKDYLTKMLSDTARQITRELGGEIPTQLVQAWRRAA